MSTTPLIYIYYFNETNPLAPTVYPRFGNWSLGLRDLLKTLGAKSFCLDSATYLELSARLYSEMVENRTNKKGEVTADRRIHYGYSAYECGRFIMGMVPNLIEVNSMAIAHISDQRDDSESGAITRKMAALPGQIPNLLPGGYGEVWRVYPQGFDSHRKEAHWIQTQRRPDNTYDCKSLLHVPDPTQAHYKAIAEAVGGSPDAEIAPMQALILGYPGAGKSHLAGLFPKPLVVALFDPPGKAQTYRDFGIPGPIELKQHGYLQIIYSKEK